MQLSQFKQQSGDLALSDQQTEQLLLVMKEEKQAANSSGAFSGSGQNQASIEAALSDEQMQKFLAAQEGVNQRVYDRAQTILSPEQMTSFGKFQTNQLAMMRMGFSMTRQFLSPAKGEGGSDAGP